jgi:outer membrane receptor protein involved in Fe transport
VGTSSEGEHPALVAALATVLVVAASARHAFAESQVQAFEHEVVVRGDTPAERERSRAFGSPHVASTVDQDTLRDETPQSLADALRTAASSVSIQQTTPGQGTVSVRGLSGRAVVYAVDGVRLNMAFFRAGNNDSLGLVDPYALGSVVVVPGAASVEYGSDALGGAVLMNTETPSFRAGPPLTEWRAFQSLASNPLATASRVSVRHEREWTAAAVGFTYYQAGDVRPGRGEKTPDPESYLGLERAAGEPYAPRMSATQLGTGFETYAADATIRQRVARGTDLLLKSQYSVRPELVRYDQVTPRFRGALPARAERSLKPMSRAMLSATLRHRALGAFYDSAEVQLGWQRIFERRSDRRLDEVCIEPVTEPSTEPDACTGRLRLSPRNERALEESSSNAVGVRAEGRSANASRSVSVIVGVDGRYDMVESAAWTSPAGAGSDVADEPRYPDGSAISDGALFVHVRARPLPKMHVFLGARGSAFLIDMKERRDDASAAFRKTVLDATGSMGIHWEPVHGLAWVANGARGVRAPNVEDYAAIGTRAQGRYQIPNPNLRPEHSTTADVGLKVSRARRSMHVAAFYARYLDAIVLSPTRANGSATTSDGDAYYHSMNAAFSEYHGVEAAFDVEIVRGIAPFGRALVMVGTQHNDPSSGLPARTPADRVPPPQGELGLRVKPVAGLALEGFVLGRSPQRRLNDPVNLDDNRIPPGGTPGYVTLHARARAKLAACAVVRLAVDNVTNALALDHGSGFYRPGFAMTGSVELSWDGRQP